MRYLIILGLYALVNCSLFGQTVKPLSNTEAFMDKTGITYKKTFKAIDKVKADLGGHDAGTLVVQVLIIENLTNQSLIKGVKIEYNSRLDKGEYSNFVDIDELSGLISAIQTAKTKYYNTEREDYTEIIYNSRAAIKYATFANAKTSKWTSLLQVNRYLSNSNFYMDSVASLDALLAALIKAQELLK